MDDFRCKAEIRFAPEQGELIYQFCRENNIEVLHFDKSYTTPQNRRGGRPRRVNVDNLIQLYNEYINGDITSKEFVKKSGYTKGALYNRLRELDLPTKKACDDFVAILETDNP